jgi:hypothetical protein
MGFESAVSSVHALRNMETVNLELVAWRVYLKLGAK